MASIITLDDVTLETLDINTGTVLRTETPATPDLADFVLNSIGEYKRLTLEYTITEDPVSDFDDANTHYIRFVPALFIVKGTTAFFTGLPPQHYLWAITSTSGTAPIAGTLINTLGMPAENRIHNMQCFFTRITATTFEIEFSFFMTQDMGAYLPGTATNQYRFLRSHVADTADLQVYYKSVYGASADRAIGTYITISLLGTTYGVEKQLELHAGFYDRNPDNVQPATFTLPVWDYTVGGSPVSGLSSFAPTLVHLTVTCATPLERALVYLIRVDTTDDNLEFTDNYEISHAEIVNTPSGVLDGALIGPALAPAVVAGSDYDLSVTIDPAYITVGAKYRVIAILYAIGGTDATVSQISDELIGGGVIPWDGAGANVTSTWRDYISSYPGGTLTSTIEERLSLGVDLEYGSNLFANDILARFGLTIPNDIRRYLTNVRAQIYERRTDQAGVLYVTDRVDMLVDTTITKQPDGSYNSLNGLSLTGGLDAAAVEFNWRNRYEAHLLNLYTMYDGVTQPFALSTQDWGGRTLTVRITFNLYYDDAPIPFTDTVQVDNTLVVNDYYNPIEFSLVADEDSICDTEEVCFTATVGWSSYADYKLLTTIEPAPGTVTVIAENEVFVGILPQLTTLKLINQDENFGDQDPFIGYFCADGTQLQPATVYKVSAIAKYDNPLVMRITDGGTERITNGGITRSTNG